MTEFSLYIVPTPIGNLEDITHRAVRVLNEVDIVLAEDTRTTKKLFDRFDIKTPLRSFHQHNEHKVLAKNIEELKNGIKMALVSDAGTPGISDPGFLLVRECIKENIPVSTLPGATAFIPALVNSGFPLDQFVFEGFLPIKKGRQSKLNELSLEKRTVILYESPHKIIKTIEQLKSLLGKRRICVSRELTKIYEENVIGTCEEVLQKFSDRSIKGEIVLLLEAIK